MNNHPDKAFAFGKNWQNYLDSLDERKIHLAVRSLQNMLQVNNLRGKRFLDASCGSGLFSLAALRLEADEVVSFDVDEDSVSCAKYLKKKYGPFPQWHIRTGSALDHSFLTNLGHIHGEYCIIQVLCGNLSKILLFRSRNLEFCSSVFIMIRGW